MVHNFAKGYGWSTEITYDRPKQGREYLVALTFLNPLMDWIILSVCGFVQSRSPWRPFPTSAWAPLPHSLYEVSYFNHQ